ncbi:MAG: hypothetical protein HYZ65_15705 [Burkholderiales bacterium]|nr:hypothetical protein [Burkholderiales bacterium]
MSYSAELFRPHLHTVFFIQAPEGRQIELLLDEIKTCATDNSPFQHFSLLFSCSGALQLRQGTFNLRHQSLPELALFLVPVAKNDQVYRYQASFSVAR